MKRLTITLVIFLISYMCLGQEKIGPRKNQISGEILTFYGIGVSYERITNEDGFFNGSLRGRAIVPTSSFSSFFLSPSIGGSLLFGKKHNLEFGIDYLVNYEGPVEGERFNRIEPIIGYRFRHKKGFTMRIFFPFSFDGYFGIPDMGLSVGCTF